MTKRELTTIERMIAKYDQWAAEELKAAEEAKEDMDDEAYNDCWIQYRINAAAADCLRLLVDEIVMETKRKNPYT